MSSKTLLTVLVFCSTICFIVGAPTCPSGWEYLAKTNACYIFKNDFDNFDGAVGKCKAMNSTLVSIHSDEENSFVGENADKNDIREFWIGIKAIKKTENVDGTDEYIGTYGSVGNYKNVDGTPMDFQFSIYSRGFGDCGLIEFDSHGSPPQEYDTAYCTSVYPFICKKTF